MLKKVTLKVSKTNSTGSVNTGSVELVVSKLPVNNDSFDNIVMDKICKYWVNKWKVTPLCNNWNLYYHYKNISEKKWTNFFLQLWIWYAESHLWVAYNPNSCYISNNWFWLKWKKLDSWKLLNYKLPKKWCRVYFFSWTVDWWTSMANTLLSYNDPNPYSMVKKYVWYYNQDWINRVNIFYKLNYSDEFNREDNSGI